MDKVKYIGNGKTPELACKDLESQLQLDVNSNSFVTLNDPNEKVLKLSPRGVNRYALANIGDGMEYKVMFSKKDKDEIKACVILKEINSPRNKKIQLFY